jgi:hygromycin-B 7''-O-kinase
MQQNTIKLPNITSAEEYDQLDLNNEIFKNAAREIISRHALPNEPLKLLAGSNVVFLCGNHIIKLFPPAHHSHFIHEVLVMKHLHNKLSVQTPAVRHEGNISGWPYIIMNQLKGTLLEGLWETLDQNNKLTIIRELGSLIREVHSLPTSGLEAIDCHWEQFIAQQIKQCVTRHQTRHLADSLVKQIPSYLNEASASLPKITKPVILTGEYTPMNFLVEQQSGSWHISGLIDFGDSMLGLPEYDLLGPGAFLIQGNKPLLTEFLLSYGYSPEKMTKILSQQLTALMLLHRYSNLNVQIRIPHWQDKVRSLNELETLVWGL